MHPVAVHWAKKSNCSAKEGYSAFFRLSAYNDSCTALTHNWESLLLNTYKQHIAHFMMWEQEKYWAVLWLIQKHVGIRQNNLSTASAWQTISAVCKKSNHLWIQSVCISLGQEKSQQSKPGFGKNLAQNSQTIIWTIHLDKKKKDPAVMCWAQDPGDLIQLGKTVPQTARHQSPWFPKEGMKENTGIPHRCFNTYGQLMTRQKCQVKFLVGDWQKGVIN